MTKIVFVDDQPAIARRRRTVAALDPFAEPAIETNRDNTGIAIETERIGRDKARGMAGFATDHGNDRRPLGATARARRAH